MAAYIQNTQENKQTRNENKYCFLQSKQLDPQRKTKAQGSLFSKDEDLWRQKHGLLQTKMLEDPCQLPVEKQETSWTNLPSHPAPREIY